MKYILSYYSVNAWNIDQQRPINNANKIHNIDRADASCAQNSLIPNFGSEVQKLNPNKIYPESKTYYPKQMKHVISSSDLQ